MNFLLSVSGGIGEIFSSFFASAKASLSAFSVLDAVDILILTAILFLAFRFLKSRKAGALLVGVAVYFIILAVSYIFGLTATNYVFAGVFKYGALTLLILFQPEIREALEKVGSGSINGILSFGDSKAKKQQYYHAIDQICTAVASLSASKTGALIVIERTTKLDDIVETGTVINADVNASLLRNLFFNKAPLHDGAVVITDARIEAAGCLLPLSRRTDVDSDLGTRHRAALGMSELSDAVTVVVSEETGIISVAYDCSLSRGFTPETLKRELQMKILRLNGERADQ